MPFFTVMLPSTIACRSTVQPLKNRFRPYTVESGAECEYVDFMAEPRLGGSPAAISFAGPNFRSRSRRFQVMEVHHVNDVINIERLADIPICAALFRDFIDLRQCRNQYHRDGGRLFIG